MKPRSRFVIHGPIFRLSTGRRARLSALYAGRAPHLEAPKWARRFSTAKASFRTRLARGQLLLVGLVPQGGTELNNARPLRTGARSSVLADAGCHGGAVSTTDCATASVWLAIVGLCCTETDK